MDYPSIRGEELPYYAKKFTWDLFHQNIDEHSQRFIDECPGYGVQSISRLQSQCATMIFADQIIYNRMFHQVVHKGGDSAINCIKGFQNAKALATSVVNNSTEDQIMYTFLEHFHQVEKYSAQIAIHQAELRIEVKSIDIKLLSTSDL